MGRLGDHLLDFPSSGRATGETEGETCQAPDGKPYVCEVGHCCGSERCCTYYYELWWFWLIWGVIILLSCCCAYHHRRKRRDARAQRRNDMRNQNALPYAGACNYPGPPLENGVMGYCKLPPYDEIIRVPPTPTPPPPYTSRRRSINQLACLQPNANGEMMMTIIPCHVTGSMLSLASLSHYVPSIMTQHGISVVRPPNIAPQSGAAGDATITMPQSATSEVAVKEVPPLPSKTTPGPSNVKLVFESEANSKSLLRSEQGCSHESEQTALIPSAPSDGVSSSCDESDSDEDNWSYGNGVDQNNNQPDIAVHIKSLRSDEGRDVREHEEPPQSYDDVCGSGLSLSRCDSSQPGPNIVLHL